MGRAPEIRECGKPGDSIAIQVGHAAPGDIEKVELHALDLVLDILAGQPGIAGTRIVADNAFWHFKVVAVHY